MNKSTLRGEFDLENARISEKNMLVEFGLPKRKQEFFAYLDDSRHIIATTVAQHLNASRPPSCEVSSSDQWIDGSFNVCIPISVSDHHIPRVVIRFPLPYKIGELHFPGNADEKLMTEAATYAWLDEHCPEVPKPRLLGYAFSDGRRHTRLDNMPLVIRLLESFRHRALKWLGRPTPCRYVRHKTSVLNTGYLLLEDVKKDGTAMLSNTWQSYRHEPFKRNNLFRDLARIMLAVGSVPMPQIGSLTIDKRGYLQLNNRPLTMTLLMLENEGLNTGIERSNVFSSAIDYGSDLVAFHDRCLRDQPNGITNEDDGELQMSTFACLRMLLPNFFPKSTRNGPFIFQLTDVHQSNFFVDQDWHITSVIDLEYAAFLPREMELTPWWLSNQDLDDLRVDPGEFEAVHNEFMAILREEEHLRSNQLSPRADTMQQTWQTKGFFYQNAINHRIGCINLFQSQVLPLFEPEFVCDPTFITHTMPLWSTDGKQVLAQKMEDKNRYDQALQEMFEQ